MILLALISTLIVTIILYFQNAFAYWKRKGVPYIQPTFPFGSIDLNFPKTAPKSLESMYNKFKKGGAKFGGFYMASSPVFMPIDPDVIKSVLTKNFDNFMDRGIFNDESSEPLTAHLFALAGIRWKNMRHKLTPTFTSGKIKMMFSTLIACSKDISKVLDKAICEDKALDIKELTAAFATDVIANCAFGLECNSILDPDTEFRKNGRAFLENNMFDKLKLMIGFMKPELLKLLRIRFFKQDVSEYFLNVVKETINYREENNVHRKDFMDLLIRLKNNENISDEAIFGNSTQKNSENTENTQIGKKDGFTAAEIAAQAFAFYIAGFETSSTTMSYTMLELAQNPNIQEKVREEIQNVISKYNGEVTYDGIMEMHYLDKVINETLRMHAPIFMLNRVCTKDFTIENTNITLEKGTKMIVPVLAIQNDPEYYPNPDIFDPERFSNENVKSRHSSVYLPFGEGPRFCIGMRFGMLQSKIGIISLLQNYKYSIHEKTKLPLKYVSNIAILSLEDTLYFKVEKI